ncbi:BON domain-containing protein [Sulfitobacter pseudonitzschiae]|uniref:BON domain-containing protein n=1 Tax=Pseudosulfitobacter pseudonitzschiae TaxID=1402135 RepID=A0A9Q2RR09_9RHOB|nr:BON domain-containing protein [Pseudosulfitobacter pseudonitzschiae]MBM2290890.1 BON domain-containing protein [Pseudosulfitobacter pseudonitzschiae]MBM2295808.1 BON domain-containing protein [Pseudosulfitobacter pseudonitzschiae]MBM2300720.1 BON domain-containing protein [Pseudosulfitobacter pseudonitzschiae]MBM2310505.1 BON domain-containing protein [Pseudosulfitobacter pseudonitzschiae]MBM2315417.1 BON domain-containing protein [Pseudosulfitobacter pseudonitzschiae]
MSDDHKIKTEVTAELAFEPSINADHIGVAVKDGVVTLSGHVAQYWQKAAAERATGRVRNVRAIVEEIEVRLSDMVMHSDDEIAAAALHRLAWEASIPKDAVKVRVQKGFITLTGNVEWRYQHDAIARSIRSLAGVTGVSNQILVKTHPNPIKIESDIENAMHRSWYSTDHIDVTAKGGEVHLTGRVDTWSDRNRAAATAWSAPGTTSVVNDIHIS